MVRYNKICLGLLIVGIITGVILFTDEKRELTTDNVKQDLYIDSISPKSSGNGLDMRLEWNVNVSGNWWQQYALKILDRDSNDNLYVVGTNDVEEKGVLSKYDKDGTLQWTRKYTVGSYTPEFLAVKVDKFDNIYVTGYVFITRERLILLKYNSSGDLQWDVDWNFLNSFTKGFAIEFDSMNNVYVAGYRYISGGPGFMYYVKFNSDGQYQSNRTITDNITPYNRASAYDIALDDFDNIYLAGRLYENVSLVKFDSLGNYEWNRTYEHDYSPFSKVVAVAIEIDALGIYLGAGDTQMFGYSGIIKCGFSGEPIWSTYDLGEPVNGSICDLKLDSSGNIYITGDFHEGQCPFLQKFNVSGVSQWSLGNNDLYSPARGLFLDSSDNIYIAGGWSEYLYLAKYSSKPEIEIISPEKDEVFGKFSPRYEISIFEPDLDEMWYSLDNGVTNTSIIEMTGKIDQEKWDNLGYGSVAINFYANDTFGNEDCSQISVYKDDHGPFIDIKQPTAESKYESEPPYYEIYISDLQSNFTKVWYTIDNGTTNISLTSTGFNNVSETFNGTIDKDEWSKASLGQVTIEVYAENTLGNIGHSEVIIEKVKKKEKPAIPSYNLIVFLISLFSIITVLSLKKKYF